MGKTHLNIGTMLREVSNDYTMMNDGMEERKPLNTCKSIFMK